MPLGRSLHWERGLKQPLEVDLVAYHGGRSLHWERGLKPFADTDNQRAGSVAPFIGSVD